jgi:hypothetical protein
MIQIENHVDVHTKLDFFIKIHKIPNIIFHGHFGSGKKTIVREFISAIYDHNKEDMKKHVMTVNCAHGKGIKFIRDELKFFAKTHIHLSGSEVFKSIILVNAEKLTIDAQSALRRCIELFSKNTRFFIIIEDKYKLLKPILSRFCEIFIPEPVVQGETINLYKYNICKTYQLIETKNDRIRWLKNKFIKFGPSPSIEKLMLFASKIYEMGYTGLDIIELIELYPNIFKMENHIEFLFAFQKIKKEIRNEKLLIIFILNFSFLTHDFDINKLQNI